VGLAPAGRAVLREALAIDAARRPEGARAFAAALARALSR
jgi:hypothetical protein